MTANKKEVGVGLIGAGSRGLYNLASHMARTVKDNGLVVRAVCELNPKRRQEAKDHLDKLYGEQGVDPDITLYDGNQQQALIDDPRVDFIVIVTQSSQHREPAVAALRSGKKVYCDKPIAHDYEDAIAIANAEIETGNRMIMGFTRRYEPPWRKMKEVIREGLIGDVHMILLRAVIPYHTYFHRWHRRREWSGGAINDKSSHHFDVFNWFADGHAERLSAFGGQRVFTPDPSAPERCSECDRECPYRMAASRRPDAGQDEIGQQGDSWTEETEVRYRIDNCVWMPGADIEDHVSAHIRYDNGVVASLFWAIFGPKAVDQETLEVVGTKGRIRLVRHTGELDVVADHGQRVETIECRSEFFKSSHFGADLILMRDMRAFVDGAEPVVSAVDGYWSARMIEATLRSIDRGGELIDLDALPTAKL